ncbi:MAG: molybdenum cofactor biosynthesis protein MoaE [Pseudomonadales bacterium]
MTDAMQRMGTAPLDPNALLALGQFPDCGGLALFAGAVRNHHEGKSVDRLIYSAYLPVCEKLLADIEAQAKARYGVTYVALRHRVGELAIGELAIVCVVQAPHRAEAFAACRWAVDQVKHGAPIWKEEFYTDGSSQFVEGCCLHSDADDEHDHAHEHHHHKKHHHKKNHNKECV